MDFESARHTPAKPVAPAKSATYNRGRSSGIVARCTRTLLATTLLAPVLLLSPFGASHADDNVISTIVNTQNGGFPLNGSDSLTITPTGGISTTGNNNAIESTGNGNTITNQGAISTTGDSADGIKLFNSNSNSLTLPGSISTTGDFADGIVLVNSNSNPSLTLSGSISTTGANAHGIFLDTSDSNPSLTLSGSISTTGRFANGIFLSSSDSNSLTLSGSISTTGANAPGINLVNSDNNIFNITGLLTSAQANAILFNDSSTGNSLNLSTGAFLGGAIDLGMGVGGNFVNINTTPGHSVIWEFGSGSVITNGIQVSGTGAYAVDGNIFYSVDTTGFFARADALGDTAGLLSGLAASRRSTGSGSSAVFTPAMMSYFPTSEADVPETSAQGDDGVDQTRIWGDVIGGLSEYGATNITHGYDSQYFGLAFGVERDFGAASTFGLMGGYLSSTMQADSRFITSQEIDSQGGFAGIYGSSTLAHRIDITGSLIGGWTNTDSVRNFNNNLAVPAFVETASGSFGNVFLAPSIGISIDYALDEHTTLTPFLSALYAHQWSDGYTETGSTANLTVGSGQSSVFEANAELGITRHLDMADHNLSGDITARLGALVRATPDSNVPTLSLAGVGTLTSASTDRNVLIAATGGLDLDLQIADNVAFRASGDVAMGRDDYFSTKGRLGITVQY